MPTVPDNELLSMRGWPRGVNNRVRETEPADESSGGLGQSHMPASYFLREAVNVDLTKHGHPLRREGYTEVSAGYTHSLWGRKDMPFGLCVQEGHLCRVSQDGTVEQLVEVHRHAPMSYAVVNGMVFWSNGITNGRVDSIGALHWSLPTPPAPSLTAGSGGSLYAGTYSVASVYVDETDQEYGSSDVATVDVEESGSLSVTLAGSWPTGAVSMRVFVSRPNGEILYEIGEYSAPGTYAVDHSMLERGRELETQDLKPVRPGKIVRYFNGRVYVARDDTVIFTEALRYGVYRPAQGIYMFPSEVILMEPVSDGVFVGTREGVVFISGLDPYDVRQTNVLSHAPIPNTVTHVPGEYMESGDSFVPVWWGVDGAMVAGLNGGAVRQLTKDRLAVPEFQKGAMLYREREGMAQVLSTMQRGGEASAMAATDTVVATVRRNTKKLNC